MADYGKFVGVRLLDLIVLREKSYKRDTKLLNMLMFVKGTVWKNLFNKEADKLERSNDDPCKCKLQYLLRRLFKTCFSDFLIEKDPLVNTFISLPKDKSNLNCAWFIAGIVEAFLTVSSGVLNFVINLQSHIFRRATSPAKSRHIGTKELLT